MTLREFLIAVMDRGGIPKARQQLSIRQMVALHGSQHLDHELSPEQVAYLDAHFVFRVLENKANPKLHRERLDKMFVKN